MPKVPNGLEYWAPNKSPDKLRKNLIPGSVVSGKQYPRTDNQDHLS